MTPKQAAWDIYKALQRAERHVTRGVGVTIPEVRKKVPCTCPGPKAHTAKHHKKSGRCRKGCDCKAGVR
jgi:hypothetical protein